MLTLAACGQTLPVLPDSRLGPSDGASITDAHLADAEPAPAWTQRQPATSPPASDVFGMAYDKTHHNAVIFGGEGNDGLSSETWAWNGTTWSNVTPSGDALWPSARGGLSMAFDEVNDNVVLFGGSLLNPEASASAETWLWNGAVWMQQDPSLSPTARTFASMAYDSTRHETLLFGGVDASSSGVQTPLSDTWAWNGTSWTEKTTAAAPPATVNTASCFDRAHGDWVLLDGKVATSNMDTWLWNGTTWSKATTTTAPPGRELFYFAYDEGRNVCVLFGGYDTGAAVEMADTWSWNGTAWSLLQLNNGPTARSGGAMVFDSDRTDIVMFSGYATSGDVAETWTLGTP